MERHYEQLARRMIVTALAGVLVPLYLLGAAIYLYFTTVQEQNLRTELRNIAASRANAIQLYLAERTSMLETLAHTAPLEELVRSGQLQETLRLLNRRQRSFVDLGVIDADGDHLAYAGPYPLEDRSYADAPWFGETMLRGVWISDVFLGFRGVPHFVVAVKSEADDEPWILRATIDSEVFTRLVRGAQLGATGDAYIVNRAGRYQTPPRFGGVILASAPFDVGSAPPGTNVTRRRRPGGETVLTATAWLPELDWLLVVDRDPKEALGPLRVARNMELAILGVGTLLIVGAVVFHVRQLVQRLAEQDRRRAEAEAQLAHSGRLASVGRMAAGVAHEVNNPLAAIGELAGLMEDLIDQRFVQSNPHGRLFADNVRKIQEHVERARGVTHRLLGFARRMEPRHDPVDLNEVVDETMSFIEREAAFKNVRLGRSTTADLPVIHTDRAQLQQVILNLLNNALDAVAEHGSILVETRLHGGMLEVAVKDDGPGIPAEIRDRIFDPFFTTKEPGKGNGLGLSISHTIMQQLGGSLAFETSEGGGTTFVARLPKTTI